jgi:hypothetical protein
MMTDMPRRTSVWEQMQEQREQLYRAELARWSEWLRQQDQLRALAPKAIRVIDEALDAGGPDAVKAAFALVRLLGAAGPAEKPHLALLNLASPEEVAARLNAVRDDVAIPALPAGQ